MPNTNQDRLYENFISVAGDFQKIGAELPGLIGRLVDQVTAPPVSGEGSSGGGGVLHTLESVGSAVLENALGASPLIRAVISLFGGGDESPAPAKLAKYVLPASIRFDAADTSDGITGVDYGQSSAARPFGRPTAQGTQTGPQITVNVQAMDARSFLDHSTEIAAAVRDAMLNSSSINDVVNEL
jgi:hypothetical protein